MEDERYPFEFEGNYEILAKILSENDPLKGMSVSKGVSRSTPHYTQEKLKDFNLDIPISTSEIDQYMIDKPTKGVILFTASRDGDNVLAEVCMPVRRVRDDRVEYSNSSSVNIRMRYDMDQEYASLAVIPHYAMHYFLTSLNDFKYHGTEMSVVTCDPVTSYHIYKKRYPDDAAYCKYLAILSLDSTMSDLREYPIILHHYLSYFLYFIKRRTVPAYKISKVNLHLEYEKDRQEYQKLLEKSKSEIDTLYKEIKIHMKEVR